MNKKNIAVILSVFMALAMVSSGCGAKQSSNSKAYKIAVTAPLTGNNAENGKNFDIAAQMAVDKINAAGGIGGVPLEKTTYDSKGDPKESVDIARRIAQDESILAVVGDFSSSSCMAAAPIYEEAGLVQLSPSSTHPDYAAMGDFQFGIMGRQDGEAPFYANIIMSKYIGTKKLGILYLNNDWGLSVLNNMESACKDNGIEVTAAEMFGESDTDFSAALSKLRQSNPDTICLVTFYQQAGIMIKQIRQMGWDDVEIVSMGVGFSDIFSELVGESGNGVYSGSMFVLDTEKPEDKAWSDEFITHSGGLAPTVLGVCAFDATNMIAKAIENAVAKGELSRRSLRDELANMEGFVGMTGPIRFNPVGDVTRKYRICKMENSEWQVLTDYDYYE